MQPKYKVIANSTDITDLLNGRVLLLSIADEIGLVSDHVDNRIGRQGRNV
ncbi:MAG: hypothetical protein LBF94_00500 [Puniceicoccales bacterium]|jgi:phage protein D|nr:hypothetical protein [Puniceicoccales bacterium]